MTLFLLKTVLAALILSFCSWLAGRRPDLAGFIVALPIYTIIKYTPFLSICEERNEMKRIKHICLFLFATLMMSPNPALTKMYKWVDEKGKTHFTDNRMNIPPQYRTPEKKSLAGKKEKKSSPWRGFSPRNSRRLENCKKRQSPI